MTAQTASEFNCDHHVRNQERMIKIDASNGAVLLRPAGCMKRQTEFPFQEGRSFVPNAIDEVPGTALVEIVYLAARALKKAVVIEQLQSPQNLLRTAASQGHNVGRTQKAMLVNQLYYFSVTRR